MSAGAPEQHSVGGLAVRRNGVGEAELTVVLVHGTLDRSASFARLMRRLDSVDVVAYDRRGYGASSGTSGDGLDAQADDLLSVLEWSRARRAVVVGHSFGGLVALRAADRATAGGSRSPIAAVGSFEAPMPWREEYGRSASLETLDLGRERGAEAAAEHFFRSVVGDEAWDRLGPRERAARLAEGPAVLGDVMAAADPTSAPDPSRVAVPVSSARGTRSRDALRWAAGELAHQFGTAIRQIDGAGHGAHLTHPGRFATWITDLGEES